MRSQTPKVEKSEKKKLPKGRALRRMKYNKKNNKIKKGFLKKNPQR